MFGNVDYFTYLYYMRVRDVPPPLTPLLSLLLHHLLA